MTRRELLARKQARREMLWERTERRHAGKADEYAARLAVVRAAKDANCRRDLTAEQLDRLGLEAAS